MIVTTLLLAGTAAAQVWTVRIEEPTGLYRRTDEVVRVPLAKVGSHRTGYVVTDPKRRQQPWQVSGADLLFPASVVPGELPEYRVTCCTAQPAKFESRIVLRRVGMRRVELANSRFRLTIDTGIPAITEAYSLTARHALNYVDESGWTSTGGSGPMTGVELLESGPLQGRLRLTRPGESWEFVWTAASAAVRWMARRGFRFDAVSASPYAPFDRFVNGSEYEWPTGPEEGEPPDHDIKARDWKKLPGGHAVYYQAAENYGALGIFALDPELNWAGIGSAKFTADRGEGETSIALTFPEWRGNNTVLEARKENRILRQPLLVGPTSVGGAGHAANTPATLSLDGDWELAWSEKGAGPPTTGWRTVKVPGAVHTQWLGRSVIYTRAAEWVSYKEWWYRRRFRLPSTVRGKHLRLQFDATDYYADAYLNGRYLGRHEGYIDPYEYEITAAADNELLVRVWTPVSYYWKHRPYTIKGAYGAVDQKPDDITPLGITRSVRIVAGASSWIREVAVDTRLTDTGAEVEVQLKPPNATYELTLTPRNFQSTERYRVRSTGSRIVIPVKAPQLWWTWDHGKPNLYTLDIRMIDRTGKAIDAKSLAVGIREIEKIGWNFYLNRRRMFIRGTNYYYNLFMSDMNRARYERDMDLMLGMNVNMIRLHCHFSNPEFYDLADERGVLLWQDYLEAWYPHDRRFAQRAAELYDNHIRYVRNHPSIAIWATSDEEDLENYRELTKHLASRPAFLDPQRRPVVRSTGRYGDAHVFTGGTTARSGSTRPWTSSSSPNSARPRCRITTR
jgi:hypothetical protein